MKQNNPSPKTKSILQPIAAGLIAAQALATFQVYSSNKALYAKLHSVGQSGYLAVPNGEALASLNRFGSALGGGLFFTLSIGALLALATVAFYRILTLAGPDTGRPKYLPPLVWLAMVVLANLIGGNIYLNLYLLLIPPTVYLLCRQRLRPRSDWRSVLTPLLPVLMLAALWFSQYDKDMFIDIRDRLLLSNPVGKSINRFYYDYTLYAAEAFKALSQKQIKTVRIDSSLQPDLQPGLKEALVRNDWLPVRTDPAPDLWIRQNQTALELVHAGRVVIEPTAGDLLSRPERILEEFSRQSDRYSLFRTLCFYGLLLGFPILLYLGLFSVSRSVLGLFLAPGRSLAAASALCLILGMMVWGYFQHGRVNAADAQGNAAALASENWRTQVTALRRFSEKEGDIKRMSAYAALKSSLEVPVRYWLVQALAGSKHPRAFEDLVTFLDDSSLNVRTQACAALGKRKDPRATSELLRRLKQTDQWYFQWYAYRAMKALGWKQRESD